MVKELKMKRNFQVTASQLLLQKMESTSKSLVVLVSVTNLALK